MQMARHGELFEEGHLIYGEERIEGSFSYGQNLFPIQKNGIEPPRARVSVFLNSHTTP